MKVITLFDLQTGALGAVLVLPDRAVQRNVPPGCGFIEGRFDKMSERLDLDTDEVVDHQPPSLGDDHEWRAANPSAATRDNQRWRWLKKPEVVERERRRASTLQQIAALELRQLRPARELAIDPNNGAADTRLRALDEQIAKLRREL